MQYAQPRRDVVYPINRTAPPPVWVEGAYYALTLYAVMNVVWGISIPLAGAGGLGLLAVFCLARLRPTDTDLGKALALPLLCGFTWLAVQVGVHGEPLAGDESRQFVTWMLSLIVVQSLMMRPGFLQRFALFAFALALMVLPYSHFSRGDGVSRMGLTGNISLANSNALGDWLGYCCLFFAVVSIETKRLTIRIVSAALATTSLLIVGLTVSRASLAAIVIGGIIAFRRTLKRGFFPLLAFSLVLTIAYLAGLFDQALAGYAERGLEETGRLEMWPLAFDRFVRSPLFGVGVSHVGTWTPKQGLVVTPHNTLLFLALSAGIVPLVLFLVYAVRAARLTMSSKLNAAWHPDQPFRLPLLVYLFVIAQSGENTFMQPWGIVTLSLAMSVELLRRPERVQRPSTSNAFTPESRRERRTFAYQRR